MTDRPADLLAALDGAMSRVRLGASAERGQIPGQGQLSAALARLGQIGLLDRRDLAAPPSPGPGAGLPDPARFEALRRAMQGGPGRAPIPDPIRED